MAFVTGAASGIGLAISKQLIIDGITKIAVIDISESGLASSFSSFSSSSTKVLRIAADCSSESEVDAAVERTVAEFGRLDVCVNAAGIAVGGNSIEVTKSAADKVIGLNLMGVWLCERAQIRQFLKQELRDVS